MVSGQWVKWPDGAVVVERGWRRVIFANLQSSSCTKFLNASRSTDFLPMDPREPNGELLPRTWSGLGRFTSRSLARDLERLHTRHQKECQYRVP